MSEIPVSTIVNVAISPTPTAPSRAGFGTLLFVTTDAENAGTIPLTEGVRYYASITEVEADWATTTEVWKAANAYFSQVPRPVQFAVGAQDLGDADVQATLTRLAEKSADWYFVAFEKATRDTADIPLIAAWTESKVKEFFAVTNDANSLIAGDNADVIFDLNASAYRRTFVVYSSTAAEYPECSAAGRAATVDFSSPDSVITLKFKDLPGITPEVMTSNEWSNLKTKGGNMLSVVGGVRILQEGIMVKGVGTYQDSVHNVDWLQNAIETNVYGKLVTDTTKTPYTDAGVASLEQKVRDALDDGIRNGMIAPGFTLAGEYLATGYKTEAGLVADQDLATRQSRQAPPINFTAIGAGAIHGIQINGVYEE